MSDPSNIGPANRPPGFPVPRPTPDDRIADRPPEEGFAKKSPRRPPTSESSERIAGFSLAEITPEEAGKLLELSLMETSQPPESPLGQIKFALKKKSDEKELSAEDMAALERAGETLYTLRDQARGYTAEAAAGLSSFIHAALECVNTHPHGPLLA